jgi:hypothetical protein
MKNSLPKFLIWFIACAWALGLAGCAANYPLPVRGDENIFARPVQTDLFPGGVSVYSFGPFQKAENFVNVERAQTNSAPRNAARVWINIAPVRSAVGTMGNLQSYFPFDVRWKLKDGREFILENIDTRGISNDFLRKHPLQMGWQRENRARHSVGDGSAILCFEVKDDTVLLKWVIRINRTPVNQRLTATGAATHWDVYDEEHIMIALKGNPTSNIDFNKTYEPRQ